MAPLGQYSSPDSTAVTMYGGTKAGYDFLTRDGKLAMNSSQGDGYMLTTERLCPTAVCPTVSTCVSGHMLFIISFHIIF